MLISAWDSEYEKRKAVLEASKNSFPKSCLEDRKRGSSEGLAEA